MRRMTRIAIVGGGPGGYEAALVAAQLGAEVTVIERTGVGGACVLTDCVPSKTLIATAEAMTALALSPRLGVRFDGGTDHDAGNITVDATQVNARVRALATAQSDDIAHPAGRRECDSHRGLGSALGADDVGPPADSHRN